MTGTLELRYEQNTPLGDCSAEAWVDRVEGVKTIVKGELRRADGECTVRAVRHLHPARAGPATRWRRTTRSRHASSERDGSRSGRTTGAQSLTFTRTTLVG